MNFRFKQQPELCNKTSHEKNLNANSFFLLFSSLVLLVIGGVVTYGVALNKKAAQPSLQTPLFSSPTSIPDLSGLSVVYGRTTHSTTSQSWGPKQRFISDITNTQRLEVNPDNFANVFSPNGTHFARVTSTTIEIAQDNDPTSFSKILDISDRSNVLPYTGFVWSQDETKLAYELQIHGNTQEGQFYTVNADGTDTQLIGKIPDRPGGRFLGFDSIKNIVYLTLNRFGETETETLTALDASGNLTEIVILPVDTEIIIAPDYTKAYFSRDLQTITELDLDNLSQRTFFDTSRVSLTKPALRLGIRFSPDQTFAFIMIQLTTQNLRYLVKVDSGEIDQSFNSPVFADLSLWSISPDSRYLLFLTASQIKPANDPALKRAGDNAFYSGRNCIWDLKEKKLIPFFNCHWEAGSFVNDGLNEQVMFIGWISHAELLQMTHRQLPTPLPTIMPSPNSELGDVYARTNNLVRKVNITALLNAIEAYKKTNNSLPPGITTTPLPISKAGADLCSVLTSAYIGSLPRDPQQQFDQNNQFARGGSVTDCQSDYDTGGLPLLKVPTITSRYRRL